MNIKPRDIVCSQCKGGGHILIYTPHDSIPYQILCPQCNGKRTITVMVPEWEHNMEIVTGTLEKINFNAVEEPGVITSIKLVGDDNVYLMPSPITVTLHRQQDHFMAVMAAEFVAHPDDPKKVTP